MKVSFDWSWPWRIFVAIGAVLVIGGMDASAARVSWSDPIDSSTNLPVNNGNVLEAVNVGGPEVVINGINFKEGESGEGITHSNLAEAYPDCCSDNGEPTGADANMALMLNSHRWLGSGGKASVATLKLEGLEVGKNYAVQLYFSDFRPGSYKTYFYISGGSASKTWIRGTTEDNMNFIGTFTADADVQSIHMVPDGTRYDGFVNHDPGLSGYVLSLVPAAAVPEPSSMLLTGMAIIGGLAVRRRWESPKNNNLLRYNQ